MLFIRGSSTWSESENNTIQYEYTFTFPTTHLKVTSFSLSVNAFKAILTLQAIGVEQIFALLVALDSALGTADTLAGQPPQEPLTLEAVRRAGRRPHYEVVRGGGGDRVDQRLQGLLVHVLLLWMGK